MISAKEFLVTLAEEASVVDPSTKAIDLCNTELLVLHETVLVKAAKDLWFIFAVKIEFVVQFKDELPLEWTRPKVETIEAQLIAKNAVLFTFAEAVRLVDPDCMDAELWYISALAKQNALFVIFACDL